jgi:Protein of unknown function (DUF3443)
MRFVRTSTAACAAFLCGLTLASCGGSPASSNKVSSAPTGNTLSIVVNSGPDNNYANGLFTTVTICAPGTSNCQNVSSVLVDTGSFGLRVLSSALGSVSGALPEQKDASGNSILECAQFVDSVVWGPVKTADVKLGSELASSVPIQVIDSSSTPVADSCKNIGPAEQDVSSLGANGILGIGFLVADCGSACAVSGSSNPGFYYSCSGATCHVTGESVGLQVQNPVARFSGDNNGIVIGLPAVTASAPSATGTLTFGIGTKSNNALASAQVFSPDLHGNLKTSFKGQTYSGFIDSGSNAYFFLSSGATGLANCSSSAKGFYCPSSPQALSATLSSGHGASKTESFTIGNASQLFATSSDFVFPTLGGPNAGSFDWGLPFFYGKKVYVGIQGRTGSGVAGPFWAY